MFGALFFVGEQVFLQGEIFGRSGAAFAGAGDWTDFDAAVGQPNVNLRRSPDDREVASIENKHVG